MQSLRNNPKLFKSIADIVELSELSDGQMRTIDDAEDALIHKIRKLGQQTLSDLGSAMEQAAAKDLKQSEARVNQREKKR